MYNIFDHKDHPEELDRHPENKPEQHLPPTREFKEEPIKLDPRELVAESVGQTLNHLSEPGHLRSALELPPHTPPALISQTKGVNEYGQTHRSDRIPLEIDSVHTAGSSKLDNMDPTQIVPPVLHTGHGADIINIPNDVNSSSFHKNLDLPEHDDDLHAPSDHAYNTMESQGEAFGLYPTDPRSLHLDKVNDSESPSIQTKLASNQKTFPSKTASKPKSNVSASPERQALLSPTQRQDANREHDINQRSKVQ